MLAKLLRIMIASQILFGASLGLGLAIWQHWPLWIAVLTGVGLPFFVMMLVDTYSGIVSRGAEPLWPWLRSVWGEYLAGFTVFLFRQPWARSAPGVWPATVSPKRIPVVLVHGYMCNHRIWDTIAKGLRARGHDVIGVDLEPLFAAIDDYAPILERAVQALLTHSGQKKVALVGHSMGGLAIRAWLRSNGTVRVARVITLGTPHAGTQIAQHFSTPNGSQMTWGSAWLKALAEGESRTTLQLFRIALTPQDNIVYPQRAQVLQGITPQVFEGIGHVQMCLDPAVMAWLQAQLADVLVDVRAA